MGAKAVVTKRSHCTEDRHSEYVFGRYGAMQACKHTTADHNTSCILMELTDFVLAVFQPRMCAGMLGRLQSQHRLYPHAAD